MRWVHFHSLFDTGSTPLWPQTHARKPKCKKPFDVLNLAELFLKLKKKSRMVNDSGLVTGEIRRSLFPSVPETENTICHLPPPPPRSPTDTPEGSFLSREPDTIEQFIDIAQNPVWVSAKYLLSEIECAEIHCYKQGTWDLICP